MRVTRLRIPEVLLLEPEVFGDERGFFFESFNEERFARLTGLRPRFVQDNHTRSVQGVLRGLHYQLPPRAQGKLVRVVQGEVFDVAVDLRRAAPSFGQWVGATLSAENHRQLWIPAGFAHGFVTLSATAELLYKATAYHAPELERCIAWDDAQLAIDWPVDRPILSAKDARGLPFAQAEAFSITSGAEE